MVWTDDPGLSAPHRIWIPALEQVGVRRRLGYDDNPISHPPDGTLAEFREQPPKVLVRTLPPELIVTASYHSRLLESLEEWARKGRRMWCAGAVKALGMMDGISGTAPQSVLDYLGKELTVVSKKHPEIDFPSARGLALALFGIRRLTDSQSLRRIVRHLGHRILRVGDMSMEDCSYALLGLTRFQLGRAGNPGASVRSCLAAVSSRVKRGAGRAMSAEQVSLALYVLSQQPRVPEVTEFERLLTPVLAGRPGKRSGRVSAKAVSTALYAASHRPLEPSCLSALSVFAADCSDSFSSPQLCRALAGLPALDPEDARSVVKALTQSPPNPRPEGFSATYLAFAMSSLRALFRREAVSGEEARAVFEMLVPHVQAGGRCLGARELAVALLALRSVGDSGEVRTFISALEGGLRPGWDLVTDSRSVGMSLFGLYMQGESRGARSVLLLLLPSIQSVARSSTFDARTLSCSLYGLARMNGNAEARAVVAALTPALRHFGRHSAGGDVDGRSVALALYGFKNHGFSPEVEGALKGLHAFLPLQ
eukprot:Hpha_TRINITY_DN17577_c0_g1::TRINITY_DN17577_c0_g1_i1::g.92611::m.92611